METIDYKKIFDVGERITLSSDFLSRTCTSNSWEQDCINVQKKCGSLRITKVKSTGIYIEGIRAVWFLTISCINLYQLEPYKENPEILYAFADNQSKQGNKRNVSFPLSMAFNWKLTPEGYSFWRKINNIDNNNSKSEKSIEISKENQQTIQIITVMKLDYKNRKLLSSEVQDQKEIEFAVQNTKLQFEADKLATQRAIAELKKKLDNWKSDYPINIQAIIMAQEELKNLEAGLEAIEILQVELDLK